MNKVSLMGYLGEDIAIRFFDDGNCMGRVSMATSQKWTDKETGEIKEKTQWHKLVLRNRIAETIQEHCGKGSKLYVEGSINYRKWKTDEGQEINITEIEVSGFEFAGDRPEVSEKAKMLGSPEVNAEIQKQKMDEIEQNIKKTTDD